MGISLDLAVIFQKFIQASVSPYPLHPLIINNRS